jgi:D-alanyl-D-alanine carboxypeptidase
MKEGYLMTAVNSKQGLADRLQGILDKQLKAKDIFNCVLAVQSGDGSIDWVGAAGIASNTRKELMQPDTPYFIASVTKMYTGAVIMQIHDKKLIDLDDLISKHLPSELIKGIHTYRGTDYVDRIKIVHLLSHTSGLADYFLQKRKDGQSFSDKLYRNGDFGWSIKVIMKIVREEMAPKFFPGEGNKAFYSDTNFQLLGAIIESVVDKPLADVFNEFIFQPLELNESYMFTLSSQKTRLQPAQIHFNDYALNTPKAMASFGPDGDMVATARECIAFTKAFFNGSLFPESYLKEMKQWKRIFFPLEYGYSLMRFKLPRMMSPFKPAPEFIGHSGSTASFSFYYPEKDLYLAGTLNQVKQPSRPFQLMLKVINAV